MVLHTNNFCCFRYTHFLVLSCCCRALDEIKGEEELHACWLELHYSDCFYDDPNGGDYVYMVWCLSVASSERGAEVRD